LENGERDQLLTPLFTSSLAFEIHRNRGHDKGADHWSYAVLLYEMIAGYTPFYVEGMDQITLFRSICKGQYEFPPAGLMSMEIEDLLQRFFLLDPAKRLGSLAGGINEIYAHQWYSEIDFAELRHKEIKAPWLPQINDPLDKSNFENWDHLEDKMLKQDPPLPPHEQIMFHNF
jgi:protein kinase A